MAKLPIGIQEFSKLREDEFIYVDKTKEIYNLIESGSAYFLSRPRRFGKSLLVNTMKEIFLGNKHLFEDLWIYDKIEWEEHPVIKLDFTQYKYQSENLEEMIAEDLKGIAQKYNVTVKAEKAWHILRDLVIELSKINKVAILVDEYDKPIIDNLSKERIEIAKQNREFLKGFYSPLKGLDAHIKMLFLTGVSKFSRVSIFSDLNHLRDISTGRSFSTILGYTQDELETSFKEEIKRLQNYEEVSKQALLNKIKRWYNGYSWDGKHTVYNPFSILNLFAGNEFDNYWFSTGTPTFLMNLLEQINFDARNLENKKMLPDSVDKYEIDSLELYPLLFQTGYLTIKKRVGSIITLDYPNDEVRNSFQRNILATINKNGISENDILLLEMADDLKAGKTDKFMQKLDNLFSGIAHHTIEKKESYFHSMFYLIARLLGYTTICEIPTSDGRIDAVIQADDYVYIIEFKLSTAEEALAQIKEKEYHKPFINSNKTIKLLGVGFDVEKKKVSGYLEEEA